MGWKKESLKFINRLKEGLQGSWISGRSWLRFLTNFEFPPAKNQNWPFSDERSLLSLWTPINQFSPLLYNNLHTCCSNSIQKSETCTPWTSHLFVCLIRKWCRMCLHCGGFWERFRFFFKLVAATATVTPFWICVCRVNRRRGLG